MKQCWSSSELAQLWSLSGDEKQLSEQGEHQKPWGSSRSVWVGEIRVTSLGSEGVWD